MKGRDIASAFAELGGHDSTDRAAPQVQDAPIAATTRSDDVTLYSQDADFDDFAGIYVTRV